MRCPSCHSENPGDSRYCRRCGSAIEEAPSATLSYSSSEEAAHRRALSFSPGDKFGDRYTIIEEIGEGGMGRVYKAEDNELGTTVVLKMIRPELIARPGVIDCFKKETLLGRSVSHENVVRIHDLGEVNNVRYISMDFIKGENLSELIRSSGSLTLSTCLQISLQVCRALKAAHEKGIVHQDLKPQNIMIDNSGRVYVTDFGLAKSVSLSPEQHAGRISGTPKYFSPEQARGEESDQRSDIYSLGVILYEMVTGKAPFKADTTEGYIKKHISEKPAPPSKFNPDLPPVCEKIILKCLEKKREDRYQSVDELIKDLEAQKAHMLAARLGSWPKILVIPALILVVGIGIYGVFKWIGPAPPPAAPGRIAVMYAVNNTGDKSLDARFRWVIPNYLITALSQSKFLTVLPQDRLMQILYDMKQLEDERPMSKALDRISEATNIGYILIPSFAKAGADFLISVTVRKAKTDMTVGEPVTARGRTIEDVPAIVDELCAKLRSRLSLSPAEIAEDKNLAVSQITTASPEAAQYFAQGQELYARGEYRASVDVLEKAVEQDPNYALAYMQIAIDYDYIGEYDNFRRSLQKALELADRVSEKDRYSIQAFAAYVLNESPLPAIEIYKKIIKIYPGDEGAYAQLGVIYRNLEEWELAIDQYEKVQMINPGHPFLIENRGFIYTAMGRYKEAVGLCEANLGNPLEQNFCARQLPLLYLIQGQYDLADAALGKSLALRPDDLRIRELKGVFHILIGDVASARRDFEQVRQRGEANPHALELGGRHWLAHLHLLEGMYRQAQKAIAEGIELARRADLVYDELEFRSVLANTDLHLKRYSLAAETSKWALDVARKVMEVGYQEIALHQVGLASLGLGRVGEAKDAAQQLHDLIGRTSYPKSMRRYEHLMGQIDLTEGHPEQAIPHFERAISLLPHQMETADEQAFYYDALATAYYQSGDWSKAIETYKAITPLTTGRLCWGDIYARSFYWLGKCYQKSGNSAEVRANYERFLKLWEKADEELPEFADAKKELEILGKGS